MGALRAGTLQTVGQSTAQRIDGGLRFDSSKSQHLTRTPSSAGNRKTWTWSGWVKLAAFGDASPHIFGTDNDDANRSALYFGSNNELGFYSRTGGVTNIAVLTSALFRDYSSWYHIVTVVDTNQSTPADVTKIYVNGVDQALTVSAGVQNALTQINNNVAHSIGRRFRFEDRYLDSQMSNVYFIDGQALGPGYFGYTDPLTNTWRPRKRAKQGAPTVNNGTTWSSFLTPGSTVRSGYPASRLFDGSVGFSNAVATTDSVDGTYIEFDFSSIGGIPFQTIEYSFEKNGNDNMILTFNGVSQDYTTNYTYNSWNYRTVTGLEPGRLFNIKLDKNGDSGSAYFAGIKIDGVTMIDGNTTLVDFGTNGFYLPLDGSAPIGQDQSGRGNNWTPVKFGGSAALDKATGALPILNTDGGGKTARPGVFGSEVSKYYTLTGSSNSSTGYVFENEGTKPTLSMIRGTTHTFDYTGATSHPLYLSSLPDGKHNSKAYSSRLYRSGGYLDLGTGHTDLQPGSGDFCIELFINYVNMGVDFPVIVDTRISGFNDTNGFFWGVRNTNNKLYLYTHSGTRIEADNILEVGKWYHLALTRESGTFRMFINGTQVGVSYSQSQNYTNQIRYIGNSTNIGESQNWYGDAYISNFRFVKGEAVYTTNFTPPQTTLTTTSQGVTSSNVKLLCCQDSSPTTAVVSPGTITLGQAGGDAVTSVNTHNPFLYNDVHGNFGVDTSTSNVTKMTVPHYAPDTLYYYCNVHSGMGNSISVTTDIKKADPYAWKNVLALPLVGSKDDVSNQVSGGIVANRTITNNGNAAASSAQSNFYGRSFRFPGGSVSDGFSISSGTGISGSDDFCIEFWYYMTGTNGNVSLVMRQWNNIGGSDIGIGFWPSGGSYYYMFYPTYTAITSVEPAKLNEWTHMAWTRQGGTLRLFVNGIEKYTVSSNTTNILNSGVDYHIGTGHPSYTINEVFNGYLSDLRVYKGVAKYTSNFIPASTDPDILPDTPSGVSYSSNVALVPSTDGAVAFDGSGDYLSLTGSSDFAFGTGDFTIECWAYTTTTSSVSRIVNQNYNNGNSGYGAFMIYRSGSDMLFYSSTGGSSWTNVSGLSMGTIIPNLWTHLAVTRQNGTVYTWKDGINIASVSGNANLTDTGNVVIGAEPLPGQYWNGFISNFHVVKGTALYTSNFTPPTAPISSVANTKLLCCKSNSTPLSTEISPGLIGPPVTASGNAAASTTNPFSSATAGSISLDGTGDYLQASGSFWSAHSPATFEAWIYCTDISNGDGTQIFETGGQGDFCILSNGALRVHPASGNAHDTPSSTISTNTWYHVALVQTPTTRKIFVNGVQQTLTAYLGSGLTTNWNNPTGNPGFGKAGTYRGDFPGYMSNIRISDYEVYTSNFTSRTTPFDTVTEANNLLTAFSRTSSTASAGTNAKATNFNPFTADIDTVRGKQSGYCTMNPLLKASSPTLSDGNLKITWPSDGNGVGVAANMALNMGRPGKYYWEAFHSHGTGGGCLLGIQRADVTNWTDGAIGTRPYNTDKFAGIFADSSGTFRCRKDSDADVSGYVTPTGNNGFKTFMFCLDTEAGKFWVGSDGIWGNNGGTGNPALGTNPGTANLFSDAQYSYYPFLLGSTDSGTAFTQVNFGQKPFKYAPPAGFQPLALANTPRPTIVRPDQYVGTVTYTGTGSARSVTGIGFSPDFVWIKVRSVSDHNIIYDTVRGAQKQIYSNLTLAEETETQGLTSFNLDGFSLGGNHTVRGQTNESGKTYVAWTWKAGGNKNTFNIDDVGYASAAAAGLTAGDITPTGASVNTKSGFSIITYTSTSPANNPNTIPHGLGKEPSMIIMKARNNNAGANDWFVYHKDVGNTKALFMNSTVIPNTYTYWNNTSPTSTVFSVGSGIDNGGIDWVTYLWTEIPGFSKFGSYEGNGNADGPFIELGFRPAVVLLKTVDTAANWMLYDNQRGRYNPNNYVLGPNVSDGGLTYDGYGNAYPIDFLSNGFKVRTDVTNSNASSTIIYAAWAEAPTFNLYGGQSNAR